ncbi:hypothetical protein A9309_09280 [Moraxella lacunata]|uniref:Uncharacterized protein n=1 Tax=Moraxella lacunata TaxID=477 RepID=A0A1B8PXU5_MORLA|nr:hypothetical protein A9309_09280 [Moraxella lacunata]
MYFAIKSTPKVSVSNFWGAVQICPFLMVDGFDDCLSKAKVKNIYHAKNGLVIDLIKHFVIHDTTT